MLFVKDDFSQCRQSRLQGPFDNNLRVVVFDFLFLNFRVNQDDLLNGDGRVDLMDNRDRLIVSFQFEPLSPPASVLVTSEEDLRDFGRRSEPDCPWHHRRCIRFQPTRRLIRDSVRPNQRSDGVRRQRR